MFAKLNYSWRVILVLLMLKVIPMLCVAQLGSKNFIDQNYIEVTGKAEFEIVPDEIYLKILLDEQNNKNKVSVADQEKLMIGKLTDIGIDVSKDLLVKDIASNFKNYVLSKNKIFLSKEYQVLVHDGKKASQIFLSLEEIGISNISIEKIEHSNIIEYRKEVKIEAIKAAKEKATSLALAINQEIGKAIYVQEINYTQGYRPSNTANSFSLKRNSSDGLNENLYDIDFEKIKLEYSILCRFELN